MARKKNDRIEISGDYAGSYDTQTRHKKPLPANCMEVPSGRIRCLKPDGSGGFRVMARRDGAVYAKQAWNLRPGEVCLVLE